MPTDWLFYWMTLPLGIVVTIGVAALPFALWRSLLGPTYQHIGIRPYLMGYGAGLLGLVLLSFTSSYLNFNEQAAAGLLREAQRWTIVPGWTVYIAVISLVIVLPLLGLIGVPVSAFLLKRSRFSVRNMILALAACWLALTVLLWLFPTNDWHRNHRLASFTMILRELFPGIAFVAGPFAMAIHWATRHGRNRPS
ncbi:hypothetical protein [Massilia sp. SYSU DXS3249]